MFKYEDLGLRSFFFFVMEELSLVLARVYNKREEYRTAKMYSGFYTFGTGSV